MDRPLNDAKVWLIRTYRRSRLSTALPTGESETNIVSIAARQSAPSISTVSIAIPMRKCATCCSTGELCDPTAYLSHALGFDVIFLNQSTGNEDDTHPHDALLSQCRSMRSLTEPNLESVVRSNGDEGWDMFLIERINCILKTAAVHRWPH